MKKTDIAQAYFNGFDLIKSGTELLGKTIYGPRAGKAVKDMSGIEFRDFALKRMQTLYPNGFDKEAKKLAKNVVKTADREIEKLRGDIIAARESGDIALAQKLESTSAKNVRDAINNIRIYNGTNNYTTFAQQQNELSEKLFKKQYGRYKAKALAVAKNTGSSLPEEIFERDPLLSYRENLINFQNNFREELHYNYSFFKETLQDELLDSNIHDQKYFDQVRIGTMKLADEVDNMSTIIASANAELENYRIDAMGIIPQENILRETNAIEKLPYSLRLDGIRRAREKLSKVPTREDLMDDIGALLLEDKYALSKDELSELDEFSLLDNKTLDKRLNKIFELQDKINEIEGKLSKNPEQTFSELNKLTLRERYEKLTSPGSEYSKEHYKEKIKKGKDILRKSYIKRDAADEAFEKNYLAYDSIYDKNGDEIGKKVYLADTANNVNGLIQDYEEKTEIVKNTDKSFDFNKYMHEEMNNNTGKDTVFVAARGSKINIKSVKLADGSYYYYREGIDELPPHVEAAVQREAEKSRQYYKKLNMKMQQQAAEENHQVWIHSKSKDSIKNAKNPTGSTGRPLTDEEIIDTLMEKAHNVSKNAQSEIANPAKTTLKDTVRLQEIAMKGFKMHNAGTLMGTVGALTLFEATMYANNSDAELHKRKVEEERRRKKYGY